MAQHVRRAPNIRAAPIGADGNVEIEPDRKRKFLRHAGAGAQLLIGDPLNEGRERDVAKFAGLMPDKRVGGLLPRRWPLLPRPSETVPQRFEYAKALQRRTKPGAESGEILAARSRRASAERAIRPLKRLVFDGVDRVIVDDIRGLQPRYLVGQAAGIRPGELGDCFDVDVEWIEKRPAAG